MQCLLLLATALCLITATPTAVALEQHSYYSHDDGDGVIEESGYLIDIETLARDKAGYYTTHPEAYTLAQAKAAWDRHTDFLLLLEHNKENEEDKEEVDVFGWKSGRNPQQQREGHHDDSVPYKPAEVKVNAHHRSSHTMSTAEENQDGSYATPTDRHAVGAYLHSRPETHDHHGYLKVTTKHRALTGNRQQVERRSHALEGNVTGASFTVEGYLSDIYCVNRVRALDGANMINNPQAHTAHCNIISICIPDGYTILTPPTSSSQTTYGPKYPLTTAGNTVALAWLRTLSDSQTNILVKITGHWDSDAKFEIDGSTSNTFGDTTDTGSVTVSEAFTVAASAASPSAAATWVTLVTIALMMLLLLLP